MKVAPFQMEVAPFFVGFHNLRSFVAIYIMSRFTHFFRNFFFTEKAVPQTFSLLECMYLPLVDMEKYKSVHFLVGASNNLSRGSAEMQPKVMMGANISPLYNQRALIGFTVMVASFFLGHTRQYHNYKCKYISGITDNCVHEEKVQE